MHLSAGYIRTKDGRGARDPIEETAGGGSAVDEAVIKGQVEVVTWRRTAVGPSKRQPHERADAGDRGLGD